MTSVVYEHGCVAVYKFNLYVYLVAIFLCIYPGKIYWTCFSTPYLTLKLVVASYSSTVIWDQGWYSTQIYQCQTVFKNFTLNSSTVKSLPLRWIQAGQLLFPDKGETTNNSLVKSSIALCLAQLYLLGEKWGFQLVLRSELTGSGHILTTFFHIFSSLNMWNRVSPRAVLFEGQSWQLVHVTFSSYFKFSFHS